MPKTLGDHIMVKRVEMGLTIPELAQKVGMKSEVARAWERDISQPSSNQRVDLASFLELNVEPKP
jgi:ribosome-binding protein aMBF1 (putative translation factor)